MDQALRDFVLWRDGGCVTQYVNSAYWASRWPMLQGLPDPGPCSGPVQLDHVHDGPTPAAGRRADTDEDHLWSVCRGHHTETSAGPGRRWATMAVVRVAAQAYISAANVRARIAGWPRIAAG